MRIEKYDLYINVSNPVLNNNFKTLFLRLKLIIFGKPKTFILWFVSVSKTRLSRDIDLQ